MSRILALDLGTRRTGVAISGPDADWAFGRGVIEGDFEALVVALEKCIEREDVDRIVVGLPRSLAGHPSDQEALVRSTVERLQERIQVPIEFEEERLTSRFSQRLQHEAGKTGGDDEQAAILILESYLAKYKRP